MSTQPIHRINRVDFVTVLVTGVLLEISIVPLIPLGLVKAAQSNLPDEIPGLSFWVVLFSALVVAYTAGRLINVVTMRMWRKQTIPLVNWEPWTDRNLFKVKPHRDKFADELDSASILDEHLISEFKTRMDSTFEVDGPFSQSKEDGEDAKRVDAASERRSKQVDPKSLWPFVLSALLNRGTARGSGPRGQERRDRMI